MMVIVCPTYHISWLSIAHWCPEHGMMVDRQSSPHGYRTQENQILLDKLLKIKSTRSEKIFRPWLGRTTFQWSPGLYYDHVTNTKSVDHYNRTIYSSPRSVHHPLHCTSTGPTFSSNYKYLRQQEEVCMWHVLVYGNNICI